jgi:hypothetical protein
MRTKSEPAPEPWHLTHRFAIRVIRKPEKFRPRSPARSTRSYPTAAPFSTPRSAGCPTTHENTSRYVSMSIHHRVREIVERSGIRSSRRPKILFCNRKPDDFSASPDAGIVGPRRAWHRMREIVVGVVPFSVMHPAIQALGDHHIVRALVLPA